MGHCPAVRIQRTVWATSHFMLERILLKKIRCALVPVEEAPKCSYPRPCRTFVCIGFSPNWPDTAARLRLGDFIGHSKIKIKINQTVSTLLYTNETPRTPDTAAKSTLSQCKDLPIRCVWIPTCTCPKNKEQTADEAVPFKKVAYSC